MCGIVAWFDQNSSVDPSILRLMTDSISHRGPDGSGHFISDDKKIGLGHRRLSVIDISSEAGQPMFDEQKKFSIVFNGEIYNYIELRRELEASGVSFSTKSDTEVLLKGLMYSGEKFLGKLNGMFAFIFVNTTTRDFIIARDRFGEKPLYYTRSKEGALLFASEMKALFQVGGTEVKPNDSQIQRFLLGSYHEDDEKTFFEGIFKFPAASYAIGNLENLDLKHRTYWVPDFTTNKNLSLQSATDKFRTLFNTSVKLRLRSDVAVGSSLSGGLDSSLIVCSVSQQTFGAGQRKSFSARFDGDPTLSEGPYIDQVVAQARVEPHFVEPQALDLSKSSLRLHWHQEEPFLSASIFLQWKVMELAKSNATTVLLDGQGADELLAGYSHYFAQWQIDSIQNKNYWKFLRETLIVRGRLLLAFLKYKNAKRRFSWLAGISLKNILFNRFSLPVSSYSLGIPALEKGTHLKKTLAEALQYNSLPALLRYSDRNSMAHSREVRLPFLDYELVDFCTTLPSQFLIHNGWHKYIQRLAGDVLPPSIRWRADKVGYAAPLDIWMRKELKTWCFEVLFSGPVTELAVYDRSKIERLWDQHQRGQNHSWALWRWISLNEWLKLVQNGDFRKARFDA